MSWKSVASMVGAGILALGISASGALATPVDPGSVGPPFDVPVEQAPPFDPPVDGPPFDIDHPPLDVPAGAPPLELPPDGPPFDDVRAALEVPVEGPPFETPTNGSPFEINAPPFDPPVDGRPFELPVDGPPFDVVTLASPSAVARVVNPEPSTWLLVGLGIGGLALLRRRRGG